MSRSYKKPYVQDGSPRYRRFAKRQANKKVRRTPILPDGRAYRKVYDSWDIADWVWYVGHAEGKCFDGYVKDGRLSK